MNDSFMGGFSISNLRGVTLAVALIIVLAIAAHFGIYAAFRGSVHV